MGAGRSSAGDRGEQRGGHDRSRRPVRERVPVRAGEGAAAWGVLQGRGVQRRVGDAGAGRGGAAGELAVDVQADARQGPAAPRAQELNCCCAASVAVAY